MCVVVDREGGSSPAPEEVRPPHTGTGVEWAVVGAARRSQSPLVMVGAGSPLALEMAHHEAPVSRCHVSCIRIQPPAFLRNVY